MSLRCRSGMCLPQLMLLLICCSANGYSDGPLFQPETTYRYRYTLDFKLEHASQPSMPGTRLKLDASVQTYVLWRNKDQTDEQLVHLQITDFAFHHMTKKPNKSNDAEQYSDIKQFNDTERSSNFLQPILFHWSAGKVLSLYIPKEDNKQMLDLKKGLVSLFQFQLNPGIYTEEDVSGKCRVTYAVSNGLITKTKALHSCTNSPFSNKGDEVLGISWNSTNHGHVLLNGSTMLKAISEESHVVSLHLKSLLGSHIASRQKLELISHAPGPTEFLGPNVEKVLEEASEKYEKVEITTHQAKHSTQSQLLQDYFGSSKKKLSKINVSKSSTTRQFHKFVRILRHAKKRDILQFLQKASGDLLPFSVDAAVAAQSPASIAALGEFLDFRKKNQASLQEKFLYSAALVRHPSKELLNLVLSKLKAKVSNSAVMETGILVIGAIIGKMCRVKLCEIQDVEYGKSTLIEGLKNAEDEAELKIYLLSLKNAQLPETIPLIMEYTEDHSSVVCSAALSALQDFPAEYISTKEVKDVLRNIFHQTHQQYDKKCRLLAAETLLATDFSQMDLVSVLQGLDSVDNETAKLLLSKIQKSLTFKHPFKQQEKNFLIGKYLNYETFSRTGKSTTYSWLLTATRDMASIYSMDLLFTESGLLKRTVSDITVFGLGNHLKAMKVSVDARGLESLMGDGGTEDKEDEDEAMVGMSAILFDVQLRPFVFFQGYMDLVSKLFTSSGEPTAVVKGNALLLDYHKWLPMQSGLHLLIECQGGIGLEVLTNLDVNIWEQQSKTNINTKAGLFFEFNTGVETAFFKTDLKSQVDADTSVNVDTMMTFSSFPMHICLELSQGDLPYRETYILSETFPEKNTVRKGRKSTLWGRDFPLNDANSYICRRLKAGDD
ncbi:microsomal triglyceride transfer protein-like [Spea bombifrons]|uniref:microsomal triglyceride transfer protein-like n=1 Tax=Spea bombifrons TaxID=233779 RepID=UPI00234906AC|nr:microsomal triglyceride transfer protein-like [Spea bombifrons]